MFSGSRIVVTGGGGFVGSHLVDAFLKDGAYVTIIDKAVENRPQHEQLKIEIEDIAKASIDRLRDIVKGHDYVVHCAAFVSVPASIQDPLTSHETNVTGTVKMLLAARDSKIKRFVSFSSSAVYGSTDVLPVSESAVLAPESPYAVDKATGEEYTHLFSTLWGLETVRLRPFNIYGPRQSAEGGYAAVIPKFISLMRNGQKPTIFGDGNATRDFIFVDDVVNAVVLALSIPDISGSVFNIASGVETSLNDLVKTINTIRGTDITPLYKEPRVGDILRSVADTKRAEDGLGFRAIVSLEEGLRKTIESVV